MAIKVGEKDLFPYLGDYGPVSIYKGEQKLAGYKWAEKSGQELYFDNTYNSHVEVEVDGKSYQDGDPTPDYPIEIHSLNDFDVVSSVEKLSEGQLQEYDYGVEYENVDKVNLSLSEPLRSVGDVKDRLFKDDDGLWKIERNVEEIILDGNWGWYRKRTSTTEIDYHEANLFLPPMVNVRKIESTHFSGTLTQNHYPVNHIRLSRSGFLQLSIKHGTFNEISELKDWLDNNHIIVNYEVSPEIETLDQELQDQLNTFKSFKGSNYIYTVLQDDNLTPTIHAKTEVKDI